MRHTSRGFTLVELLVVIGIIALLIGLLMPTINKARAVAQQARTLAAMREMLMGYLGYQQANNGALLFGYPPGLVNGVPLSATLPTGQTITSHEVQRYPFRIAPYLGHVWRLIDQDSNRRSAEPTEAGFYELSLNPTFGLNTTYLGGDQTFGGFMGFNGYLNTGKHVAFRITEVRRSTEIIVFIETKMTNDGKILNTGFHRASPPYQGAELMWYNNQGKMTPFNTGNYGIPSSRSVANRIVTGFLDGHAAVMTPDLLFDMRLWAPHATTPNYNYLISH